MPRSLPPSWIRRWPTIRAVLVSFHVAAVVLLAIPAPDGVMRRSLWDEPMVQTEIRGWADRLGVAPEALQDGLWRAAGRFLQIRGAVVAPFQPYARYAGVDQSFRMFSAPDMVPFLLDVSVRERGAWRKVYVSRSDELTWMRPWLDDHSLRRAVFMVGLAKNEPHYDTFCAWLADRAARDFPDATDLLVRRYRYRTAPPESARAGAPAQGGRYEARRILPLCAAEPR